MTLRPTPVFDTYWSFAAERQRVFLRRVRGEDGPWTTDPILRQYKFTNCYRASDRVSQYLIREVIPTGEQEPRDWFFRIMLFKLFNRIETWQLLVHHFGVPSYADFTLERYDGILSDAMDRGQRIYSAAYIMPSGAHRYEATRKHQGHLHLLDQMMRDRLPERLASATSMASAYRLLLAYPTIGPFLAYQFVTDLNYSPLTSFAEDSFVVAGPGALDGLAKCFANTGGRSPEALISMTAETQEVEFKRRGIEFFNLFGRRLQLIDCQNLFCEISKYARVRHPDVAGISGRTRIKQGFTANPRPFALTYPERWGITQSARAWQQTRPASAQLELLE